MPRNTFQGPALLSLGLRPFFLAALWFGLAVIPLWWLIWRGGVVLDGPFRPTDWHVHEMIFGYGSAVIAGFLFTAIPNWTGRMPKQGWPLAALALLWLSGRGAVAGILPLGPVSAAIVDCAFLAAVGTVFLVEIAAGRNWRNLKVVVPLGLLLASNVIFHAEALIRGSVEVGARFGLAVVIFLITLIGGRIIPSFTRNWMAARGVTPLPSPFGRFDGASLAAGAVALAFWALGGQRLPVAVALSLAGVLHAIRLARWRGAATWRSPLLLMLHVAYAFVPLGLLAAAGSAAGLVSEAAGMHLLGAGAMGGMTLAVMVRATLGHTGRDLVAGVDLTLAFGLLIAAALVRALVGLRTIAGFDGITLAAILWTAAIAIAAARLTPWLAGPKAGRKPASTRTAEPDRSAGSDHAPPETEAR